MKLTCGDRLILVNAFPASVPPLLVGVANKLREALPLTEAEIADWAVVENGKRIEWNPEADTAREINVGPKGKQLLADALAAAPSLPVGPAVADLLDKFGVVLDTDD